MNDIGHRVWAIAEGYIPDGSTGAAPEMTSHETANIMRALLSAAIIMLSACASMQGSDPTDISLAVLPASAAAGDSITLTLDNGMTGPIGYNLCASALQRQAAAGWDVVPTDIVCTMELRGLEAGREASFRTVLPAGLTPGQYRYITNIELMETTERHAVASQPFTVTS